MTLSLILDRGWPVAPVNNRTAGVDNRFWSRQRNSVAPLAYHSCDEASAQRCRGERTVRDGHIGRTSIPERHRSDARGEPRKRAGEVFVDGKLIDSLHDLVR
ncbi:MAG: hypothetical protein CL424_07915 [Acidimicrobiaceae bacterium]|nr:hypothetical protein [Acidimicrobiaceae bacterium]